jgi:amino acid adenylation domain-containing protein
MKQYSKRIAALSPEQRALLELKLNRQSQPATHARTIPRRSAGADPAPLSLDQERLWFIHQMDPSSPAFNINSGFTLIGSVDVQALARSINEIVRRHEILRTRFFNLNGQPVQIVLPSLEIEMPLVDLRHLPEPERRAEAQRFLFEYVLLPFDLSSPPLLRAVLLRMDEAEYAFLVTMHHAITDWWSLGLFKKELSINYQSFVAGRLSPLPELPLQYADFAQWQREWLRRPDLNEHYAYWDQQLASVPHVLELPTDFPRPPLQTFRGATCKFSIPKELCEALKSLSREEDMTLYMSSLAVFVLLLYRYTGQRDVVLGSPSANRNHAGTEELIGYFLNTLVLRTQLTGDETGREFLRNVRRVVREAFSHQDVPFGDLVARLNPARDLSRMPLVQVAYIYLVTEGQPSAKRETTRETSDLRFGQLAFEQGTSRYELTCALWENDEGLYGHFEYNVDLFAVETVQRMASLFQKLLEELVKAPDAPISELQLSTESERRQMLLEWNDTRTGQAQEVCLKELFEAQAERAPQSVAIVCQDEEASYQELNERANQLAHYLERRGAGVESLVGICMKRNVEMVVALLAVLKAGAAYVPLDPEYPRERLAFIIEDARVSLLLTEQRLSARLPAQGFEPLYLDVLREEIAEQGKANLPRRATGENLAYILYTSGSTGRPKGIALTQANAAQFVQWAAGVFSPEALSGVLASTSICFDPSVLELFVPLCFGGRVILVDNALALMNGADYKEVRLIGTVPTAMAELVRSGAIPETVHTIALGGEALRAELAEDVLRLTQAREVYNLYGPTETTVYSTYRLLERGERVTIGRPVSNEQVYLLDAAQNPVAMGIPGELYIGGTGLARGYLNRPELTAEKFIPDPFSTEPGARLYRTGDVARYLFDGRLQSLGRIDQQVKVRGYRIELEEIEAVLQQHSQVRECAVIVREDGQPGNKWIAAYVVAEQGQPTTSHELRRYLKEQLPEYMIPAAFVFLEGMPLLPNGKMNHRALPAPDATQMDVETTYVVPRTPIEEMLAGIWSEVLGVRRIGVHDDFFMLGGHSLLATQVLSRVRNAFQVEISLRQFLEQKSVAGLSQSVESALSKTTGMLAPAILPVPRHQALPLSFAQQRLWFIDQLDPGGIAYNIPLAIRLRGRLNIPALERTLSEIIRRHEVLRTTFRTVQGAPVQVIHPARSLSLEVEDLSEAADREAEVKRRATEEAGQQFDLSEGPLLRVRLLRLSDEVHVVLCTMHHIVSDGWSMGVLVREVGAVYSAYAQDQESPLPELPVQYADFAEWQRQWLQGDVLDKQLAYWKEQLGGELPALQLPTDHARPLVWSDRGAHESFALSKEVSERLKHFCRGEGATLFMTLLAGFQALLHRYTGQDDILVGTPIANRNSAETENLIGFFVNTLVLRTDVSGDPTFRDLLQRVKKMALGAYTHQDLPFAKLVEELQPDRDLSRNPLVQAMFVLQNAPLSALELRGLTIERQDCVSHATRFDLEFQLQDLPEGVSGLLTYNADLFEAATIRRFLTRFAIMMQAMLANPDQRLSASPLLPEEERQQILLEWSGTRRSDYPRDASIAELFEEEVLRSPESVALTFEGRNLTYSELNARANRLARHLRSCGVGPETLVGLCLERSTLMVVALLGILKAGGAYLPLDPKYPQERLRFMLDDAQVSLLITGQHLRELFTGSQAAMLLLDQEWPLISHLPAQNLKHRVEASNLAYVMYTSGSTGTPKGVCLPQRAVIRLVRQSNYAELSSREVFLQLAPLSFDASTFEVWGALLNGARLVMMGGEGFTLEEIGRTLREQEVSTLLLTSGLFHLMVDHHLEELKGVRQVLAGGDVLSPKHVLRLVTEARGGRLINVYGPTENATFTSCHTVSAEEAGRSVPIGRPVSNTHVYILDERLELAGVGMVGELYTGGDGLARGYLHRAELTAEKFIPDPYGREPGGRLYRTGDLARYGADGTIEFTGRSDEQVKIRGFRIEPKEVEAVLGQHESVRDAVVLVREDEGAGKRLVAYVVPHEGAASVEPASSDHQADNLSREAMGLRLSAELRGFLEKHLPSHMVPASILVLESLPLTLNGKVDQRALPLPSPGRETLKESYAAPRTPAEELLTSLWSELLRVEGAGINDDFFELGGHSLLATQLISRVRESFNVDLPLRSLFESPTVAGLTRRIETALRAGDGAQSPPLVPVSRAGRLPLSFAQQRLWFTHQLDPQSAAYNILIAVRLTGQLDQTALERTLEEIVRRHETLRTTFGTSEGRPVQIIAPHAPETSLPVLDLSHLPEDERMAETDERAAAEARQPFDLNHGPLYRASLLRLDELDHVLLFTMHHIISDGWSMGVLVKEVAALYEAFKENRPSPLASLPIQYADFAVWQREWLRGEVLERELSYWKQQLGNAPQLLELPTDYPRPSVQTYHGAAEEIVLSPDLTRELKELSRREGVTLFMTLLAAWQVLLSRYTNQLDFVVGTDIANRNRRETESLIGFFINQLVIRADLSGEPTFAELLRRVRQTSLSAYAHQDVPFEKLVKALQPRREASRASLFQVKFTLQNAPLDALQLSGLQLSFLPMRRNVTHLDMFLSFGESAGQLEGRWEYNTDLFRAATIRKMCGHFEALLHSILAQPATRLHRLEILTETEKQQQSLDEANKKQEASNRLASARRKPVNIRREPNAGSDSLPA